MRAARRNPGTLPPTFVAAMLLVGALVQPVRAAEDEARLRTVDYSPASVLTLTGFVGYHIHFEFAPEERFVTLGAGDTTAIDVGAEANHLLLKPRLPMAGTNLTILTNRRAYFVDFRALDRAPRPGELTYSVTFRYPPPASAGSAGADAAGAALDPAPPAINREYWFCGSPALRPAAVEDDGLQIRISFPPHTELPAIYAAEADGAETLVNSHVEDDTVVVHRTSPRLVLRRGPLVGCVVNRALALTSRRGASGTVVPFVERTSTEDRP